MSTTTTERKRVGQERQVLHQIGPNPVAPTPARPLVDPTDVPPRPTRPLWAALFPGGGNVCEAPPEPLDASALASLTEARGSDRLVAELAEALGWLDAKIRATCQELVTAHPKTPVVNRLVHMASYRAHYQARAEALGGPQGIGLSLPLGLIRYCEHHDPLPQIRHELGQARAELAGIVAEISLSRSAAADDDWYFAWLPPGSRDARPVISEGLIAGGFPATSDCAHRDIMGSFTAPGRYPARLDWPHIARGPQDGLLWQLGQLARRQSKAEARVSALEADQAGVVELVASRVKLAVQAAGGASALTAAVHSGMTLTDEAVVDPPELQAIAEDLDRLAKGGVTEGDTVASLEARQREVLGELAAIQSLGGRRRRQRAVELVQGALAGGRVGKGGAGATGRDCAPCIPGQVRRDRRRGPFRPCCDCRAGQGGWRPETGGQRPAFITHHPSEHQQSSFEALSAPTFFTSQFYDEFLGA